MADPRKLTKRFRNLRASYNPEAQMAKLNERLMELMAEVLKLVRERASTVAEPLGQGAQEPARGPNDAGYDLSEPRAGAESVDRKTALESLATATTVREEDGKRQYLLHRATADHEYAANTKENQFSVKAVNEWVAKFSVAEATKAGLNPVVSCWVPEASIVSVPGSAEPENASLAGQSPQKHKFRVLVRPGKYQIYQELKP